jgi:predicted phosphate transport protein (TIGR00153 family)
MRFLPSDEKFYDCFESAVKKVVEGGDQLAALIEDFRDVPLRAQQIKDTEHEGDVVTHNTIEMLNRTFITPLDREDIHKLITSLDDVLDYIEACAARLNLFKVGKTTDEARLLVGILVKSTKEVEQAVFKLRRLKGGDSLMKHCAEINRLENEGDFVGRTAVAKLFEGSPDPLEVIKWNEIYDTLENAIDRCEDVANVLEGIVLKNA